MEIKYGRVFCSNVVHKWKSLNGISGERWTLRNKRFRILPRFVWSGKHCSGKTFYNHSFVRSFHWTTFLYCLALALCTCSRYLWLTIIKMHKLSRFSLYQRVAFKVCKSILLRKCFYFENSDAWAMTNYCHAWRISFLQLNFSADI